MSAGNDYTYMKLQGDRNQLGNNYYSGPQREEVTVQDLLQDLLSDRAEDRDKSHKPSTDPADQLDKARREKGETVDGTCQWILQREELETWRGGDDGKQFLWLLGAPGIGKTMISCFLVDELRREVEGQTSTALIHHFCDYRDDQRCTAIAAVRAILVQLLRNHPELFDAIKDDYILRKSMVGDFDALRRPMLRMLQDANDQKIYILIDALDECKESSRKDLLYMLREFKMHPRVRVLVTARPELDIEGAAHSLGQALRLDSAKINDDLSRFINIRVDELQKQRNSFPQNLINDIRKALQDKAGGTFLWASLLLKDIAQSKTSRQARKKLDDLPSGLHDVYRRILESIQDTDSDAVHILQWVAVSRRPMTLHELATAQALATETWEHGVPQAEDVDEFLDGYKACGPLLYHDAGTDTINLVHQSAKDYLLSADCNPPHYRVDGNAASLNVLKTCWTYLAIPEFQGGLVILPRGGRNVLHQRAFSRRFLNAYGFLGYSTEALLRGLEDDLNLLIAFISQWECLHEIPRLRDFWLHMFAYHSHAGGVRTLIEKGADPHEILWALDRGHALSGENSLLHVAAAQGSMEICTLATKHGVDVNRETGWSKWTALQAAAARGHTDVITMLIKNGAIIDQKGDSGATAFGRALGEGEGREDAALLLLKEGADPEAAFSRPEAALILAAERGLCRVVETLVARKLPLSETNENGHSALSVAVRGGHVAIVRMLTKTGADVQWKDRHSEESLLHLAARQGHEDVLAYLIEILDINTRSPGGTALHAATWTRKVPVITLLAKAGADLNIENSDGWMALHLAASCGYSNVVGALLDAGAGVDTRDRGGLTALHLAAEAGRYDVITTLHKRGSAIDAIDNDGSTALHRTAERTTRDGTEVKTARLLLKYQASVHAVNLEGATPLHRAARAGQEATASLFLRHGANANACDASGMTALHWAAAEGQEGVANILLKRGSSIDARDCHGCTPILVAAVARHGSLCCRLIARGADIATLCAEEEGAETYPKLNELRRLTESWLRTRGRRRGNDANNLDEVYEDGEDEEEMLRLLFEMAAFTEAEDWPLEDIEECFIDACKNGHHAVVSMLLAKDLDRSVWKALGLTHASEASHETLDASVSTESVPTNGQSALHAAASDGHDGIVKLLLDHGANPDARYDGSTPLLIAARNGHAEVVKTLLDAGPDPSQRDRTGPALHWAAKEGHTDVVQVLLEHNTVLKDSRGPDGATPLIAAVKAGSTPVVPQLLAAGADVAVQDSGGHTAMR